VAAREYATAGVRFGFAAPVRGKSPSYRLCSFDFAGLSLAEEYEKRFR
jgi:hypothetical protein